MLEPRADGFRNYLRPGEKLQPEVLLVDRAYMLDLTAPEMTVLVGGLRVLGRQRRRRRSTASSPTGRACSRNDFFVNLLDPGTPLEGLGGRGERLRGPRLATGEVKWTATAVDLIFGSNSQLRALAEVYASDDASEKFVRDFVAAWTKVMELDRFDLQA